MAADEDDGPGARIGRPPLTERRKAATRLEIAREAVRLFAAQGVAATTADEIAAAAGISPRTLWRYCSSKEECVSPLLTTALDAAAERLTSWPRERTLTDGISEHPSGRSATAPADDERALRDLVRLARTEPGLRAVWLQLHHAAEPVFARVFAARTGLAPDALEPRVQAALLNSALRVAVEEWAWNDEESTRAPGEVITEVLAIAAAGLPR
ncbi:TetR/AcrR family transcriptional regulator [Streptomyces sp. BBFR102]|uniref:TetR/AcrR family transcriptional regulator n=1 Tax=Streptomyces sp. BBFR102 TaxID=3448171 RepID=UPI003F53DB04